ncbi:hypothetical protein PQQ63_32255 [Paraburkholderia metrosideri]|uniref:Uncharacterized protein n=1 Tax=Paraburkholderia metrosideri TaxID=580937 RepID=A0ABW9E1W8_9BURK
MKFTRRSGCGATLIAGADLEVAYFQLCLCVRIVLGQIHGDAAQDCKVLRCFLDFHTTLDFAKDHVEYPVHAVFDALKETPLENRATPALP